MYPYKLTRLICYASVAFIAFLLLVIFFVSPVQADVFVFGSLDNNTPIVLPNDSYVHQGDNISQGNYYDLSGVYGWSGVLANWNDDFNNAGITNPDHTVTIDPRHIYSTYIDPAVFPAGRWYQFDGGLGCYGGTSSTSNNGGTILGPTLTPTYSESGLCTNGFGNGNAFVFRVVAPVNGQGAGTKTVYKTSYVTILQNGESVQVPVTVSETETITPAILAPTEQPTETVAVPDVNQPPTGDAQDVNGYGINGPVVGAVQVTASAPVPVWITVFAILVMLIVKRRGKWRS